jgi:hypothetical protein
MSDAVTLVAGILLTSVGLLTLLPYVLKRGWRNRSGDLTADSGYASVMAAVDAFAAPPGARRAQGASQPGDLEELLAHLFSLRMTVSEIAAEVEETRDALDGEEQEETREEPAEGVA